MKLNTSRADLGKQIHTTVASLGEEVSIDWGRVGELPVVRLTLPILIAVWVTAYPLGKTSVVRLLFVSFTVCTSYMALVNKYVNLINGCIPKHLKGCMLMFTIYFEVLQKAD